MKKITLKELWEAHPPDIVSFAVDTDISKKTDRQGSLEEWGMIHIFRPCLHLVIKYTFRYIRRIIP